MLLQVTREAFLRYMKVIKRVLTDAAGKESARAAGVALQLPQSASQTPAPLGDQPAGKSTTAVFPSSNHTCAVLASCEAHMRSPCGKAAPDA